MNKNFLFLFGALFIVIFFNSCEKESAIYENNFVELGFLRVEGSEIFILTDNDNKIIPKDNYISGIIAADSLRVLVRYNINEEFEQNNQTVRIAEINYMEKILFKPYINFSTNIDDSIGNDPIQLVDIWVENHLLNIYFSYLGGNMIHYINLVDFPDQRNDSLIRMEIRHNNQNDGAGMIINKVATFELKDLLSLPYDSLLLDISAEGYNQNNFRDTLVLKLK